jgi:O-antigen/teichoic acid export membrane protein
VDDRWALLLIGLATLPFLALNALRVGTLRGLGNVVLAQLPEQLARPGIHLLVVVCLLITGWLNSATALVSLLCSTALAFLLGASLLARKRPPELREAVPGYRSAEWIRAWVPFTLIVAASALNGQIGILLLGWLGTDQQIGALRVAERGASLVMMSLAIANMVIAPHITHAYREGDRRRLQLLSRASARAALSLAVPIAVPMVFFGTPIIRLVFGAEYVPLTVTPLAVLAGAQLISVAFGSVGVFLAMTGFERDTLLGQTLALALNVIAAIFLIPRLGAAGAAIAAALGMVTWNVVLGIKFVQRLGLRPSAL